MKAFLILLFGVTSLFSQGQSDTSTAPMKVKVTDFKNNPRQGERIQFTDLNTKTTYVGTSNENGEFHLRLPGGTTYSIEILGVGEDFDYTNFEIPALKPNEQYGQYEYTIQFELPKTFTLDRVFFDTGKASLKNESETELNELLEFMKLKPKVVIQIAGHTDDVGDAEANQTLSEARAKAVKAYLVKNGISASRIKTVGYGESKPIAPNDSEANRKLNRRTEVEILSGD